MIFKVSAPKEGSVSALIKEVNKISCRLQLDFENGFVTVEDVNDSMIDNIIELIDNYYIVLKVDIDNIVETVTEPPAQAENITELKADVKTIEPQSEEDLIIEKVKFKNAYIEKLVNKFLRTAYWAMFKMNIPETEIGKFIWTSIVEISMRYNKKDNITFSVGDIVECKYGMHLVGEINGDHVSAIVCNISDAGMAYVVPIAKVQKNPESHSYLTVTVPDDITYDTNDYVDGIALLDKGQYVSPERFRKVIGKTSPAFFAKVLKQLAGTFDFTDNIATVTGESVNVAENETTLVETCDAEQQQTTETTVTETALPEEASTSKVKYANEKVSDIETALLEVVGTALDKLDSSKKAEEQVDSFLADIGMPTNERIVKQSFVIACDIKKITYENVILELHKMYPTVNEDTIKAKLKETFKKWLEQYPELEKKSRKFSLMSVLKVFAKRLA